MDSYIIYSMLYNGASDEDIEAAVKKYNKIEEETAIKAKIKGIEGVQHKLEYC